MYKKITIAVSVGLSLLAGAVTFAASGVVRGSYINVRKEAKFDSPIIGKKMRGDRYEIEFTDNNWLKVKFSDGVNGWIYKTLVERTGDDEDLEIPKDAQPPKKIKSEKKAEKKIPKKPDKKKDQKDKTEIQAKKNSASEKHEKQTEKQTEKDTAIVEISGTAEELYNEAIKLYEKRKYAQALELNQEALKKAPKNAEILNNIGNCQFKMGRIEDALSSWKEALRISPQSGKICNNLGIAYYQMDKNKEAVEFYKKAILFEPQFPDPYYNLASVYGFTGKFEDAILNYKKFLEFSPDPTMKKLAEERIAYCERQIAKESKTGK
ncbi:MAG: hypothetical protein Kow0029_27420 [Candidatus Rifleibacteriota bacterium]